jgi:UDPglucose 6-dehydrogenase
MNINQKIGIIGLGITGGAIFETFKNKIKNKNNVIGYDKYKNGGIGNIEDCLKTDIIFIALPTLYDDIKMEYDKSNIFEVCQFLNEYKYNGVIIIKSTIEPETTDFLCNKFNNLEIIHNPEFLTTRTALYDFMNQNHIVLGKGKNCSIEKYQMIIDLYKILFPDAFISECTALESESMKIYCNSFYAVKVQFFTELYLLCQKNGCCFDKVRDMMIKNNWINPMHTNIPGHDGNISYGGLCFPKDTNALSKYMEKKESPHLILKSTIEERNNLRND